MVKRKKTGSDQTVAMLKAIPLFEVPDLCLEHLQTLAALCGEEKFEKGAEIFAAGQLGAKLYIIKKGKVRISLCTEDGSENSRTVLGPGDFFGEMALIGDGVRSTYAHADGDCSLLSIHRDHLKVVLLEDAKLAYAVLRGFCYHLALRLRATNELLCRAHDMAKRF